MADLNKQDASGAIEKYEALLQKSPDNVKLKYRLIQAYLLKSGLNSKTYLEAVFSKPKNFSPTLELIGANQCKSLPQEKLANEFQCLAFQAIENFPSPENEHFLKAKKLFSEINPADLSNETASKSIYLIGGFIYLGSSFSRLISLSNDLLTITQPPTQQEDINQLSLKTIRTLKSVFSEFNQSVESLLHTFPKISEKVEELQSAPILSRESAHLELQKPVGFTNFLKFFIEYLKDPILVESKLSIQLQLVFKILRASDFLFFNNNLFQPYLKIVKLNSLIEATARQAKFQDLKPEIEFLSKDFLDLITSQKFRFLDDLSLAMNESWIQEKLDPLIELIQRYTPFFKKGALLYTGWAETALTSEKDLKILIKDTKDYLDLGADLIQK